MMSADRREQLIAQAKKVGEEQKIVMRNARRDANKHADGLGKGSDNPISEDEIKTLHEEIQELLKKYESQIDDAVTKKAAEIREI